MKNQTITFSVGGVSYTAPSLETHEILTEKGMAASFETVQEDSRTVEYY